ncbi:MAG: cupin domain-containing protein [Acidobacteria bacterium]|nr:cupin domain-containing protein [Acidobacteriota bacterium]
MNHTQTEDTACELAALYALGALDREEARSFEEHLGGGCAACAVDVAEFVKTGAALAWGTPPRTPPEGVREKLLARVSAQAQDAPPEARAASSEARPASTAAGALDLLVVRAGEGEWAETSDPGVSVKLLFVDREHDTYTTLVRMSPGARVPAHRHRGAEQCLVLEGDLRTVTNVLHAGDFNCAPAGSIHDELTTEQGALLLIVAPESYEVIKPRSIPL